MDATVSPRVVGRYAVFAQIASGGMATVHLGRLSGSVGFSRTVALKRLHPHLGEPEFLESMIDEARLAARIHHPNVVPTLDVVAADGELLVVMEYIRGESLSRLLLGERQRGRRVPMGIASAIAVGALHGLHAAHEATGDDGVPLDLVHRDVSPQNLLIGVDGVPRVIDFGVAKAAGRLHATSRGVIKGKMRYMAPEQLAGGTVTRSVDVYAMAIVLWEMLAGKPLFDVEGEGALFGRVLAGATTPPSAHTSGIPAELDALVMKGLAREPDDRFPTAREMADALVRTVPPAFSTDVGAWVAEVASKALAERAALLANIESSSVSGSRVIVPGAVPREDPLMSSVAPKSPSLPADTLRRAPRTLRYASLAVVTVLAVLVGLGVSVLAKKGRTASRSPPVTASAPSPNASDPAASAAPAPAATEMAATATPTETKEAAPPLASVVVPRPPSRGRTRSPVRKNPAPAASGAIVYPQPD